MSIRIIGLRAGVPDGTTVSEKFGERHIVDSSTGTSQEELHDCGLVYAKSGTYFLCVMTRGSDFPTLAGQETRVVLA